MCPVAKATNAEALATHDWLRFLLRFDAAHPTHDCAGRPLRYTAPQRCGPDNAKEQPVPASINVSSVFKQALRSTQDPLYMVWVVTHRFQNDDGYGPVALVAEHPSGLTVEALGALRLPTQRVHFDRWPFEDQAVIVARGQHCMDTDRDCETEQVVMLTPDNALVQAEIHDQTGACVGMARIRTPLVSERSLPSGAIRRIEQHSSLGFDPRYLVLTEQGTVGETAPDAPSGPRQVVQSSELERFLHVHEDHLSSRQRPLWPQLLQLQAGR